MKIIKCETGGTYNPSSQNWKGNFSNGHDGKDARGWSQIIWRYHTHLDYNRLFEPRYNIKSFSDLSDRGTNWGPWIVGGCYP